MLVLIIKFILFLFFCAVCMVLCLRLQGTHKKLVQLHEQLERNEKRMAEQRRNLEREAVRQEIEAQGDVKS
jgi:hypothetical protein